MAYRFLENTDGFFIIKRVLKTDSDLDFLLKLDETELATLVAVIRGRVEG